MLILIAESKTMVENGSEFTEEEIKIHMPSGIEMASEVMHHIGEMNVAEIASTIKVSSTMAGKILRMAYDFPLTSSGLSAIESFTGVVFRALGYATLPKDAQSYVDGNVCIISSLYGWLRPLDIVKPYRMEFNTRLAPGDKDFASYWRKDVTINLVNTLREKNITDILDLMPSDAAKCVDKKLVKRFAGIWKVDFKQIQPGGVYRTPHAGRLKTLRGELLREIALRGITDVKDLLTLETPAMLPLGTPDYPDHIAFCVDR
ncbi:MAG: YaaA family protein [Muribaculaceae bacterium]|nr:YaaA family protein [Muribaculaceae bacterium]